MFVIRHTRYRAGAATATIPVSLRALAGSLPSPVFGPELDSSLASTVTPAVNSSTGTLSAQPLFMSTLEALLPNLYIFVIPFLLFVYAFVRFATAPHLYHICVPRVLPPVFPFRFVCLFCLLFVGLYYYCMLVVICIFLYYACVLSHSLLDLCRRARTSLASIFWSMLDVIFRRRAVVPPLNPRVELRAFHRCNLRSRVPMLASGIACALIFSAAFLPLSYAALDTTSPATSPNVAHEMFASVGLAPSRHRSPVSPATHSCPALTRRELYESFFARSLQLNSMSSDGTLTQEPSISSFERRLHALFLAVLDNLRNTYFSVAALFSELSLRLSLPLEHLRDALLHFGLTVLNASSLLARSLAHAAQYLSEWLRDVLRPLSHAVTTTDYAAYWNVSRHWLVEHSSWISTSFGVQAYAIASRAFAFARSTVFLSRDVVVNSTLDVAVPAVSYAVSTLSRLWCPAIVLQAFEDILGSAAYYVGLLLATFTVAVPYATTALLTAVTAVINATSSLVMLLPARFSDGLRAAAPVPLVTPSPPLPETPSLGLLERTVHFAYASLVDSLTPSPYATRSRLVNALAWPFTSPLVRLILAYFIGVTLFRRRAQLRSAVQRLAFVDFPRAVAAFVPRLRLPPVETKHVFILEGTNSHPPVDIQALWDEVLLDGLSSSPLPATEPPVYVHTLSALEELCDRLSTARFFAIDTEFRTAVRSYMILCLLQITVDDIDFVIDAFTLADELHLLRRPFADARILKLGFNAGTDRVLLERDFGLIAVNFCDVSALVTRLSLGKRKLSDLVAKHCNVTLNKEVKRDWRVRPLPADALEYARNDTRFLHHVARVLYAQLSRSEDRAAFCRQQVLIASKHCPSVYVRGCCSRSTTIPLTDVAVYRRFVIKSTIHTFARKHNELCSAVATAGLIEDLVNLEQTSELAIASVAQHAQLSAAAEVLAIYFNDFPIDGMTSPLSPDESVACMSPSPSEQQDAAADSFRRETRSRTALVGGSFTSLLHQLVTADVSPPVDDPREPLPQRPESFPRTARSAYNSKMFASRDDDTRKIVIYNVIGEEDKRRLAAYFPELLFEFLDRSANPHAFANAVDYAMQHLLSHTIRGTSHLLYSTRIEAVSSAVHHLLDARGDAIAERSRAFAAISFAQLESCITNSRISVARYCVLNSVALRTDFERLLEAAEHFGCTLLADLAAEVLRPELPQYSIVVVHHPQVSPPALLASCATVGATTLYVVVHIAPILLYSYRGYDDVLDLHFERTGDRCDFYFADCTTGFSTSWYALHSWTTLPPNIWFRGELYYSEIVRNVGSLALFRIVRAPSSVETPDVRSLFQTDVTLVVGPRPSVGDPYRVQRFAFPFEPTRLAKIRASFATRTENGRIGAAARVGSMLSRLGTGSSNITYESAIKNADADIVDFLIDAFDCIQKTDCVASAVTQQNALGDAALRPREVLMLRLDSPLRLFLLTNFLLYVCLVIVDSIDPLLGCVPRGVSLLTVVLELLRNIYTLLVFLCNSIERYVFRRNVYIPELRWRFDHLILYIDNVVCPAIGVYFITFFVAQLLIFLVYKQRRSLTIVTATALLALLIARPRSRNCLLDVASPDLCVPASFLALEITCVYFWRLLFDVLFCDRRPLRAVVHNIIARPEFLIFSASGFAEMLSRELSFRIVSALGFLTAFLATITLSQFRRMIEQLRAAADNDFDSADPGANHFYLLPAGRIRVRGSVHYSDSAPLPSTQRSLIVDPETARACIDHFVSAILKRDESDDLVVKQLKYDILRRAFPSRFDVACEDDDAPESAYENGVIANIKRKTQLIREARNAGHCSNPADRFSMQTKLGKMLRLLNPGADNILELGCAPGLFQRHAANGCAFGQPSCKRHGRLHGVHYEEGNIDLFSDVKPAAKLKNYKSTPPPDYVYWLSDIALDGTDVATNQCELNFDVYETLYKHFVEDPVATAFVMKVFIDDIKLVSLPFSALISSERANNEVYVLFLKSELAPSRDARLAMLSNALSRAWKHFEFLLKKKDTTRVQHEPTRQRTSPQPTSTQVETTCVNAAPSTSVTKPGEKKKSKAKPKTVVATATGPLEPVLERYHAISVRPARRYRFEHCPSVGDCLMVSLQMVGAVKDIESTKMRLLEASKTYELLSQDDIERLTKNIAGDRTPAAWLSTDLLRLLCALDDISVAVVVDKGEQVFNLGAKNGSYAIRHLSDHFEPAFLLDDSSSPAPTTPLTVESADASFISSNPTIIENINAGFDADNSALEPARDYVGGGDFDEPPPIIYSSKLNNVLPRHSLYVAIRRAIGCEIGHNLRRYYPTLRASPLPIDERYAALQLPARYRPTPVCPLIISHTAPCVVTDAVANYCTSLTCQLYSLLSYVLGECGDNPDASSSITHAFSIEDDFVICKYSPTNAFHVLSGKGAYSAKLKVVPIKRTFVTSPELAYCHAFRQLRGLAARGLQPFELPIRQLLIVDGVAGCGKTYMIKTLLDSPFGASLYILVLCATRRNARDLSFAGAHTVAGFLAKYQVRQPVDLLVVDEATMLHSGLIFLVAALVAAKNILLVGDSKQIPNINRDPLFHARSPPLTAYPNVCLELHTTHRLPLDAARVASRRYRRHLVTHNRVTHSIRTVVSKNPLDDCRRRRGELSSPPTLMTFTQEEKNELRNIDSEAATVHECEGLTAEHVILVRLTDKDYPIFTADTDESTRRLIPSAHQLVAITRHTKTFTYITCVSDDLIALLRDASGTATFSATPAVTSPIIDFVKTYVQPGKMGGVVLSSFCEIPPEVRLPSVCFKTTAPLTLSDLGVIDDRYTVNTAGDRAYVCRTAKYDPPRSSTPRCLEQCSSKFDERAQDSERIIAKLPSQGPPSFVDTTSVFVSQPRLKNLHPVRYRLLSPDERNFGCWFTALRPLFALGGVHSLSRAIRLFGLPLRSRPLLGDVLTNVAALCCTEYYTRRHNVEMAGLFTDFDQNAPIGYRCHRLHIYYGVGHIGVSPFPGCTQILTLCLHRPCDAVSDFVAGLPVEPTLNVFDSTDLGNLGVRERRPRLTFSAYKLAELLDSTKDEFTTTFKVDQILYPRVTYSTDESEIPEAVELMQEAYDAALPGVSAEDYELDDDTNLFEDVYTPTTNYRIDYARFIAVRPRTQAVVSPRLRTGIPNRRMNVGRVLLAAVGKRNFLVGKTMPVCAARDFAMANFETFISTYCHANAVILLEEFGRSPIANDVILTAEWVQRLDAAHRRPLESTLEREDLWLVDPSRFELHLKPDPKAAADGKILSALPKGQVINAMHKRWTAVYSPIMREALKRFRLLLRDEFVATIGYSTDALNAHANWYTHELDAAKEFVEVDFSSFDKNAQQPHLEAFMYLLLRLGVPFEFVDLWRLAHARSISVSRTGVTYTKAYQTQSGDASTAFVNTYTNMYICASLAKYATCGYFMGDDSLLAGAFDKNVLSDFEDAAAIEYNMSSKVIRSQGYGYFCGSYLVRADNWRFMTDPIKRIERLGRHDLNDYSKLAAMWVSYNDLLSCYNNYACNIALAEAVASRTKSNYDYSYALRALYSVGRNVDNFLTLYVYNKTFDRPRFNRAVEVARERDKTTGLDFEVEF